MRLRSLVLERLEDRCTPATWGNPWPDAAHLSLSLAPDGTAVGAQTSSLFQTLGALAPRSVWELAVLRAFQTWAINANINISVAPDGRQAFGTTGAPQGDTRFGDIRLAAYPFTAQPGTVEDVAVGAPFAADAGTWAGDVMLNSNAFVPGNGYDLFTVILHEAGHAFGLAHSPDASSVMFEDYLGQRATLSAGDIAALQDLYGVREPDAFEGPSGNDQQSNATPLSLLANADGSMSFRVDADLTSNSDVDWYGFSIPAGQSSTTVQLQTAGFSLLAPELTVYDASGRVVGSGSSTDPTGSVITVKVVGVAGLSNYYVKVEAARSDVFGIGSYRLSAVYLPFLDGPVGTVADTRIVTINSAETFLSSNETHTDDTPAAALELQPLYTQTQGHFNYGAGGAISDRTDVDFYRVQAPQAVSGEPTVLIAAIWSQGDSTLIPRLRLFDAQQNPIDAEILVNEGGNYVLQAPDATPDAVYYIEALAANPQGDNAIGAYYVGVGFGSNAVLLKTDVDTTLDETTSQELDTLTLTQGQLTHFVLSATGVTTTDTAVRMTIYNDAGNVLFTWFVPVGEPLSVNVFLPANTYTVRLAIGTRNHSAPPRLRILLRGDALTDPIGPQTDDGSGGSSGSGDGSTWTSGSSSGNVPTQDPYSDPYAKV